MRSKPHSEYAAASKADTFGYDIFEMIDRDGFALCNAINVDKLGQHVTYVVLSQKLLCFCDIEIRGCRELPG
jgi:hypothetical protein